MSVDIVNLIENNPITKLNGNYQSKLIEKVQKNFTGYEQQMFVASFYCYLKYDNKNDYVIDLDNVWQWLGFNSKFNSKRLLEKFFRNEVDYKILLLLKEKQDCNTHGGHNKEKFMLNVDTFKKLCMKACTKKADEIHDYFIKLEHVLQEILLEESVELKQQLLEIEDKQAKEYNDKIEKQKVIEREKILLKEYATAGAIFYVIKVKTFENGQYVVKVGESRRGVLERYKAHKAKYEECILLDCFSVQKSKDFESFVKDHEHIKGNKVVDLPGHETEMELFLIGKNLSYSTLSNIISNNLKYFNNNDTNKLELEIEQLKLIMEMKNTNNDNVLIHELIKSVKHMSTKIDNLEKSNKELMEKINSSQTKTETGFGETLVNIGPRLQKINPETLELVTIYENVSAALKENQTLKRPSINKAIIENTIYNGFRWLFVDRELDPNIIHAISPTKQTKIQTLGYIAQINKEKTEIVNVFLDRKTAAINNGYESSSALDNPVKNFTLTKGHFFKLYNDCEEELKTSFEVKHGQPILYKNGIGQFDSSNKLIKEFSCKYDCIQKLNMSDKTLAKALTKNKPYNGFYFKELTPRVSY
jgi:phage anti-repressor protein